MRDMRAPADAEQLFRLMPITRSGVAISLWMGVASEGWVILRLA